MKRFYIIFDSFAKIVCLLNYTIVDKSQMVNQNKKIGSFIKCLGFVVHGFQLQLCRIIYYSSKYQMNRHLIQDKLEGCLNGSHAQAGLVKDQRRDGKMMQTAGEMMKKIGCQQRRMAKIVSETETHGKLQWQWKKKTISRITNNTTIHQSFQRG